MLPESPTHLTQSPGPGQVKVRNRLTSGRAARHNVRMDVAP
jgi:hypothetical protein